jgi:hypothetical protein
MKIIIMFALCIVAFITSIYVGWRRPASTPRRFITGVYVGFEQAHYCVAWDTIVLSVAPHERNLFRVRRHVAFQCVLGDRYQSPQYSRLEWSGFWDPSSLILNGMDHGPNIRFFNGVSTFNMDGITYTRIE